MTSLLSSLFFAKSVAGDWGFTVTGSRIIDLAGKSIDVAAVGTFTLTKDGKITGKQTVSLGGKVAPETFTGTFTLLDDGTGTASIKITSPLSPRVANFSLVVTDRLQRIRMIFTDQGTISVVEATRIQ